jgi:hypothetical protein
MRNLTMALAAILLAEPIVAAEREVIQADWARFQQRVSGLKLEGRSVRVSLRGGGLVKTNLLRVKDDGMVVRLTRAVKQWKSGEEVAQIPKEQVAGVRFGGRIGHRGLIGALGGFGAGVGIGVAVATSVDCYEGACIAVLPAAGAALAGAGALAGYFIGRATGRPAPEFVLTE